LGEIDQAIEQFKLAVSLEPTFDEARNNLASALQVRDLITVERQLGFNYQTEDAQTEHYQWFCPKCRRAMFGLAQGRIWNPSDTSAPEATQQPS